MVLIGEFVHLTVGLHIYIAAALTAAKLESPASEKPAEVAAAAAVALFMLYTSDFLLYSVPFMPYLTVLL